MNEYCAWFSSPIGHIRITGTQDVITSVNFTENFEENSDNLPNCVKLCLSQLDEYFREERTTFELPLAPQGTEFQKSVWNKLTNIPHGKAVSYKEVANVIGNPDASRAVGNANNKNPISIIIPCHRVIGKNGKLTGYAGGLWRKEWLIKHEKSVS